ERGLVEHRSRGLPRDVGGQRRQQEHHDRDDHGSPLPPAPCGTASLRSSATARNVVYASEIASIVAGMDTPESFNSIESPPSTSPEMPKGRNPEWAALSARKVWFGRQVR